MILTLDALKTLSYDPSYDHRNSMSKCLAKDAQKDFLTTLQQEVLNKPHYIMFMSKIMPKATPSTMCSHRAGNTDGKKKFGGNSAKYIATLKLLLMIKT